MASTQVRRLERYGATPWLSLRDDPTPIPCPSSFAPEASETSFVLWRRWNQAATRKLRACVSKRPRRLRRTASILVLLVVFFVPGARFDVLIRPVAPIMHRFTAGAWSALARVERITARFLQLFQREAR
jgi:hypothetical protein